MSLVHLLKKKNINKLFTTPSHGGNVCICHKFYQWYKSDISETYTHNPQEALKKAEEAAAKIYGTKYTKFLTNGSTSGVIAAVLSCKPQNILIWNNAHPCHKNAAVLSGANIIEYSLPLDNNLGVYKAITVEYIEELLSIRNADCIIITSPTYEGFAADVKTIAKICRKYSVKLIVDEAHGALYPFSDLLPESAVKFADYTIQSLHKTAGGINPTALLHSNDNNPINALELINTTSPSYPMLATIEANIKFLNSIKGRKCIEKLIRNINLLDIPKLNDDVTKILLNSSSMTGFELSDILYNKYKIEDERTNDKTTMLLCGIGTNDKMFERLKKALSNIYNNELLH